MAKNSRTVHIYGQSDPGLSGGGIVDDKQHLYLPIKMIRKLLS